MCKRFIVPASVLSVLAACVALPGGSAWAADSIGVHWFEYNPYDGGSSNPQGLSPISEPAGIVPQFNWNNVGAVSGGVDPVYPGTNLLDSNGVATTASVNQGNIAGSGSYWWVTGSGALDSLLVGPWGGGGGDPFATPTPGTPAVNQITGIPASYSSYEIIAYVNDTATNSGVSAMTVWLDGTPGAASPTNAASAQYYFSNTGNTPGFVQITNTSSASHPLGNYVRFTGLSGPTQVLWITGTDPNPGIESFQIVDTSSVPEPASLSLLGAGVMLLISRRRK